MDLSFIINISILDLDILTIGLIGILLSFAALLLVVYLVQRLASSQRGVEYSWGLLYEMPHD